MNIKNVLRKTITVPKCCIQFNFSSISEELTDEMKKETFGEQLNYFIKKKDNNKPEKKAHLHEIVQDQPCKNNTQKQR